VVVAGLDAAHRAVGLPGSSHAEAALARGHDVAVLLDQRIVEGGVVDIKILIFSSYIYFQSPFPWP